VAGHRQAQGVLYLPWQGILCIATGEVAIVPKCVVQYEVRSNTGYSYFVLRTEYGQEPRQSLSNPFLSHLSHSCLYWCVSGLILTGQWTVKLQCYVLRRTSGETVFQGRARDGQAATSHFDPPARRNGESCSSALRNGAFRCSGACISLQTKKKLRPIIDHARYPRSLASFPENRSRFCKGRNDQKQGKRKKLRSTRIETGDGEGGSIQQKSTRVSVSRGIVSFSRVLPKRDATLPLSRNEIECARPGREQGHGMVSM
jgi:hypothetical protein